MTLLRPFALMLALLGAPAAAQTTLTVTGAGTVAAAPDMATLRVSVAREAATAQAALAAMSGAAETVADRLRAAGVEGRDLQTGRLSLGPRWDRGDEARIAGYVAETVLTVRVRDLDGLGALIDAAVGDGANGLSGPEFGLSAPRAAEDEARRAAFADAMAKARLYAGAAGLEVGPVVSITEGPVDAAPGPVMMEARMAGVPVERGEVETRVSVQVVVELNGSDG
ncbi:SIMPL domain-containing protein [Jannaschia sp. Os4]|uniref:SIMPL domain-containing protein n=1 Tax=Jannaschia sp. Os4 TaxID=2807617 RepID=UPI001939FCBF|nr:SIMPL domain-containing protein [Jannaschia sp. Os4]MBM2577404.1 SIMPL domain-containing protein [Jannaschia sp. Os4]